MQIKKYLPSAVFLIISSALLLELILFVAGQALLWQRRTWKQEPADVRIVCLGDSHTFGVGTSASYAYPQQLEKILNMNNPALKFSVVNLGVPGSSTKDQVRTLGDFFKNNDAQIVLWLTGRNNDGELKRWTDDAISRPMLFSISRLRSVRLVKMIWDNLSKKDQPPGKNINPGERYVAYLNFYLQQGRGLCRHKGAKLILLSYYNSSSDLLKTFAAAYRIPYFDFTAAFKVFSRGWHDTTYVSPDRSHMNRLGYKYFSEQVYTDLFLHPEATGILLGPLARKVEASEFYASPQERKKMIVLQETRLARSKGSWTYPFELIHLGHIYSELGDDATAMKYYRDVLVDSAYADNNTIVSPLVGGYLKAGKDGEALKLCDEILSHNAANKFADGYRNRLLKKAAQFSGRG